MTTIDWHREPICEEERALRGEVINIMIEDGLAEYAGGWSAVRSNLWRLTGGREENLASDLRAALDTVHARLADEREARRARDVQDVIDRAQKRLRSRSAPLRGLAG
jgi:hypothetical protein